MKTPQAAAFDFDGTMRAGDSIVAFLFFAARAGRLRPCEAVRALLAGAAFRAGLTSDLKAKIEALRFTRRMTPSELSALCEQFAREKLLTAIACEAMRRLRAFQAQGARVCIASASPDIYMCFVARALGCDLIATHIEPDGTARENCAGEEKARRVRLWLTPPARLHAFGNSRADLPMLRAADCPVCVNATRGLRRAAPDMPVERW